MRHRPTCYPLGAARFRLMQVVQSLYGRPVGPARRVPALAYPPREPDVDAPLEDWVVYWMASDADQIPTSNKHHGTTWPLVLV